ncbi:Lcl domain-containing protein [Parabacteroides provencensis]
MTLCNAGTPYFATRGNDNYNGTGNTQTASFVATTPGSNANSNVWYVGENIRPAGSNISSQADRNSSKAPANASYIRITSAAKSIVNTAPAIGEEYIKNGTETFNYDIYLGKSSNLTDFSLRRHTNYTITSTVSGTLAAQKYLAANDGRVTMDVSKQAVGLCIGLFGGASGYTTGTGATYTITGSYTKMLLLSAYSTDKSGIKWSDDETTRYQPESRRFWDHTYTLANIEKGSGYAYDYCNSLNVNGETGWYLPTQTQLMAIWAMKQGIDGSGKFKEYRTSNNYYWASTEGDSQSSYMTTLTTGGTNIFSNGKAGRFYVRCVKDAGQPLTVTPMATTINGYPVIDLSALNPLGCLLPLSEANSRREAMHACTPSNTEYLSVGQAVSNHSGTWNAKMSTRYQVMRDKLTNSSGGTSMTWADAWNACKAYSGEGGTAGQWRLPTQRELQMIWVLHPQLIGKGGFTTNNDYTWTATEGSDGKAGNAWTVSLYSGSTNRSFSKTNNLYVRCVRDI